MIYQQINEYEGGEYSFFPDQSTHDLFGVGSGSL